MPIDKGMGGQRALLLQEPVRARHYVIERRSAPANDWPGLEMCKVYPHPAQDFERRPGPLVGRFDDHELVAGRLVVLRARRHELEGVLLRESIGSGYQEMVTHFTPGIRFPNLRIPAGKRRQASAS